MKIHNSSFYADYNIAEKKYLLLVYIFVALKAKDASNGII